MRDERIYAGEMTMPTYITLLRFTQQGIQNIKESPNRIEAARKAFEARGGRLRDVYAVTGQYDMIGIIEAPDDETAAALLMIIAQRGNAITETLRAFTMEETREVVRRAGEIAGRS